jgi:hypothetical protein
MYQSVVFVQPVQFQVSAIVCGHWERPPAELVVEFWTTASVGSDPHDACSAFIEWCVKRTPGVGRWGVFSVPGRPWAEDDDFDQWDWYDRLTAEFAKENPPPVLFDLDRFTVTVGSEVVWPPAELRGPPTRRRSHLPGAVFAVGWFGTTLGAVRPGGGTYSYYPPEELPPVRVPLSGSFDWLRAAPERERPMAAHPKRTAEALNRLAAASTPLPPEFVHFFRTPELWNRIWSPTDCYLNVDSAAVDIRGGLGTLVRFMSDSQGCIHWSLYLPPDGARHSVVATHFFAGSNSVETPRDRPHPRDVTTCADSFEEFVYRYWIETSLWSALNKGGVMPPGGGDYLDFYRKG